MTDQEKEIKRVISYIRSCRDAGIDTTITIDKTRNHFILNALEEIQQYRAIGTVEECREARERQEPRLLNDREIAFIGKSTEIQSRCPQCGIILGIGMSEKPIIPKEIRHCFNCGQKLYR